MFIVFVGLFLSAASAFAAGSDGIVGLGEYREERRKDRNL